MDAVFWLKNNIATIIVINSAAGTASHTPKMPIQFGRSHNNIKIKPKVRKKDKIADNFPLDKAVKAAETKILNPQNKKLKGKIRNPFLVIS